MKQYRLRKGFQKWSSSTVVELVTRNNALNTATVRHAPSKEIFEIPMEYLVERRMRNK